MKKFTFSLLLFLGLAIKGFSQCPAVIPSFSDVNTNGYTYTFTNTSTGTDGSQTYAWGVYNNEVGTSSSLTYTFPTAGVYDVCLNIAEPRGCNYDDYCKTITVGSGCPNVTTSFSSTNVSGYEYTFINTSTGTNGYQAYVWAVNGDSLSVGYSDTMTWNFENGTYNVCLYVTEPGGCTYTPSCQTVNVTTSTCAAINENFTSVNGAGNEVTLTDVSTGENTFDFQMWALNGEISGEFNPYAPTPATAGTYNVCLIIQDLTQACNYVDYCKNVTVGSPCPPVAVSFTDVNTTGYNYTFTNSSTGSDGNQTYAWTVNGTSVGTGSALSYTFPSPGSYNVCLAITEPGGCTYTSYCKTIAISSCPSVNVSYTDVNTSGNTYEFTDASTGENGSQTYNWTINGSSVSNASSLNYTFSSSGTYTVCLYITEPGGCSYTPYCKTITIGSCTGVSATYTYVNNGGNSYSFTNTSTGTNGSQTYQWTVNNSDVGTGSTLNYTFSSAGTYDICLTISESGCTFAPYCQTITISSCPSVNVAYTYVNSGGYSYTFTDASTGENGSQSYVWTVNGSAAGGGSALNYTFSSAGSYTVCLSVTEPGGCTYQQYCRTITIASCPNVVVNFTDVNNGGTSYTFTDASTGENGNQTYSWTVNGNSLGTGSVFNYTFSSSGTYDVCLNVTEPGGCTYASNCKTISIGGCPSVVAAYTYTSTGGNVYTFTNASTGTNGSQTYQWTVNNANVGTGSTLNYTFTSSGTYDVCLNVAESGCTYAPYCQNFTITTCPNITVSFNDQSNGGNTYTFTDASTGENGNQTATWSVNGATVGTGATFNYTFPSSGSYTVCLEVSEPGGCNYSQSCRSINVVGCPSVVANYTYINNGNNSYTFTDASTGENGSQSYNWTVAGTSEGTGSVLNYTFANTGTYTVCLNVTEPGCTYTPYCGSITINTVASVIITTTAATGVTTTSANLNGTVTSNGTQVNSLAFNWGTTGNYGNTVIATPSSASGNTAFDANITGLLPNTTYYFQATGTVSGSSIYGGQLQFTTGTTGVPVISATNFDISVYPNPAGQQFTVNTHSNDTYTLNLYNMIGQRALTQLIAQPVSTVDVSTLANGIYNAVIEKDNTVKTYRLVVLNK